MAAFQHGEEVVDLLQLGEMREQTVIVVTVYERNICDANRRDAIAASKHDAPLLRVDIDLEEGVRGVRRDADLDMPIGRA
jgi:hypothetical protein